MSEYVVFSEELLRNFYDPATCSYMVPLSGKAAHDMRVLRDENAKLKHENTALKVEVTRLKAENVMLRELVDELWALAYGYVPDESELDAARDMMRELGIEVGE